MPSSFLVKDYNKVIDKITDFISYQIKSRAKKGVFVGLSGGIDSSVCAVLACRALVNKKVVGPVYARKRHSTNDGLS